MELRTLGPSESPALQAVRERISARFGLVPSFFMQARAEPPIVDAMFGLVEFAYFDAPLPPLFKERLFTYVSRFCAVPYCMARHCAFLLGHGNVAGHPAVAGISVEDAVAMLRTPFPDAERRDSLLAKLRAVGGELERWPDPRSDLEDTIFFAAAVAFVMPQEHKPLLAELGNAVKFTPLGGVTLTVVELGDSLAFSVTDSGPGIPSADHERIFEPFTQLDQSATRQYGGTGLGLAITKRLVTLLDGTIRVDANEGSGSTFVVTLPYRRRPASQRENELSLVSST